MYLFRDYQLKGKTLLKIGIDDQKHLMWQWGGVPCIDVGVWEDNKYKIDNIVITTKRGRRFEIKKKKFEKYKQPFNFGFGLQFIVPKKRWESSYNKLTPEQEYKKYLI